MGCSRELESQTGAVSSSAIRSIVSPTKFDPVLIHSELRNATKAFSSCRVKIIGAGAFGALFLALRRRGIRKGCVGSDGNSLIDKNEDRFRLHGSSLKPGEKVSIKTKKVESDSSRSTLEVVDLKKDLGACEGERASR